MPASTQSPPLAPELLPPAEELDLLIAALDARITEVALPDAPFSTPTPQCSIWMCESAHC